MTLTVEYLKQVQSDIRQQSDKLFADWQATLGALELLDHLVSVAKEGDAPVSDGIEIGHLFAAKDEPHAD